MLKGWQIAKINANREKKPYKQMKDRNMNDVKVVFKKSPLIQNKYRSYYFVGIEQPSNKITMTYIANLGMSHIGKRWTHHGGGGYVEFLTLEESQFTRMKIEVERLGGTVELIEEV